MKRFLFILSAFLLLFSATTYAENSSFTPNKAIVITEVEGTTATIKFSKKLATTLTKPSTLKSIADAARKKINKAGSNIVEGLFDGLRRYNIADEFAKGASTVTRKISNAGKEITLKWTKNTDEIIDFGNRGNLKTLLGTAEDEAHHIISWTKGGQHRVVQSAAKDGFHLNSLENGIGLSKYKKALREGIHANHPAYDDYIVHRLSEFAQKNRSFTPADANNFIQKQLIPDMVDMIEDASKSTLNLNQYFKEIINPNIPIMLK